MDYQQDSKYLDSDGEDDGSLHWDDLDEDVSDEDSDYTCLGSCDPFDVIGVTREDNP
jgi:hypothetical protein